MTSACTRVSVVFVPDRVNRWLRFADVAAVTQITPYRREVDVRAGSLFCQVYWQANRYGTTRWQLTVMQAAKPGQYILPVTGIRPGVIPLLRVSGHAKVQRVLALIDAIEALPVQPYESSPAFWQVVHNRLLCGLPTPVYDLARHAAYVRRQALLGRS